MEENSFLKTKFLAFACYQECNAGDKYKHFIREEFMKKVLYLIETMKRVFKSGVLGSYEMEIRVGVKSKSGSLSFSINQESNRWKKAPDFLQSIPASELKKVSETLVKRTYFAVAENTNLEYPE